MPFLNDPHLDRLLDEFPALTGQPRLLEELHGGLTNRNIKVSTPTASYVARCDLGTATLLGIDRTSEYHNSRAAERAGVGAPVIDYRPDLGILLVGFLEGTTLTNADFQKPDVLARVADGCRALHRGPRFRGRFDMFERQPGYLRVVQEGGFRLPASYGDFAGQFDDIGRVLRATDTTTVPCNNDLLAANFIDDGERVWIIDYEYSGNNEASFEIANVWSESTLPLELLEPLVTSYWGAHDPAKVARARLWALMSQYGWMLWASIQDAISPIDFDFWTWGLEKYDRAVATFDGPDLERLIDDVTGR